MGNGQAGFKIADLLHRTDTSSKTSLSTAVPGFLRVRRNRPARCSAPSENGGCGNKVCLPFNSNDDRGETVGRRLVAGFEIAPFHPNIPFIFIFAASPQ
jgi:hypothetical protein